MKVKVQPLTADAFAPFGQILSLPTKSPTAVVDGGLAYWADLIVLPGTHGPVAVGYSHIVKRPFTQDHMERHMATSEYLQPARGNMIVLVGPPMFPDEPGRLPPLDTFAAFLVEEGQAVALSPGTWHYAPFAADKPIGVSVIFNAGTGKDDAVVVPLPDGEVFELDY